MKVIFLFRTAIIDYVKYNNYTGLQNTIRNIINNYPKHVVDVLMNMLDTHDTVRIINAFCNCDFNNMSNDDLSRYVISSDEMEKADPSSFHLNNTFAKKW